MRLLNAETLAIEEFFDRDIPPYAILSHTWGEGEVSLQDMESGDERARMKAGYVKIKLTCQKALQDNLKYAWVDTCCIDKSSSAELSEAINSMFMWYWRAQICYAFLADVPPDVDLQSLDSEFVNSRWFARGWTLQELLAPPHLVFCASDWSTLAYRHTLTAPIAAATGIDEDVLQEIDTASSADLLQLLGSISIAERMSWAATRETTRTEDIAYCLLGIFDVSMPLLYGEGDRAFLRLQEEIIKRSNDESIFAWNLHSEILLYKSTPALDRARSYAIRRVPLRDQHGILAESPLSFAGCGDIIQCKAQDTSAAPFSITNLGVKIELPIGSFWTTKPGTIELTEELYALLRCQRKHIHDSMLAVPIQRKLYRDDPLSDQNVWERVPKPLKLVDSSKLERLSLRSIYIATVSSYSKERNQSAAASSVRFWIRSVPDGFNIWDIRTSNSCKWRPKSSTLSVQSPANNSRLLDIITIPFALPTSDKSSFIGIQLRARQPWELFSWTMPVWADCRVCTISPERIEAWFEAPPIQLDGTQHAELPDANVVFATVKSGYIMGAHFFAVDIHIIPRGSINFRFRLLYNQIKQITLSGREKAEAFLHWLQQILFSLPFWLQMITSSHFFWETVVAFITFFRSQGPPAFSTNIAVWFPAIDLAWYLMAAIWEKWDRHQGRTRTGLPVLVHCGIYAAITKIALRKESIEVLVSDLIRFSIMWNRFHKPNGKISLLFLFSVLCYFYLLLGKQIPSDNLNKE